MLRIIYHSHCFDGLVSAALFTRFYREHVDGSRHVEHVPTTYTKRQGVDPSLFLSGDGTENAIVDFKYSADPRVTWWFDHHMPSSTFPTRLEQEHYEAGSAPHKYYDPEVPSCARLIWRTLGEFYSFAPPNMADAVDWADRIDSGDFRSAAEAVELQATALRIGLVVQFTSDPAFVAALLADLEHLSLDEIVTGENVASRLPDLERLHWRNVEEVRSHARFNGGVLFYDISHYAVERVDRYIPYYLEAGSAYSVGITRTSHGVKVSAGRNPWASVASAHSIARVCQMHGGEYGGGGHDIIGGISLGPGDHDLALDLAGRVVATLNSEPGPDTWIESGSTAEVERSG